MGRQSQDEWGGKGRKRVIRAAILVLVAVSVFRLFFPVDGQWTVLVLIFGASTVLFLLVHHTTWEVLRSIRGERRRLEPYTALVTTLVTGIVVLLLSYLLTYLFMFLAYAERRSNIVSQFFFELIQQVRLFEAFHPLVFAATYTTAGTLLTIAVLIVYPFIPVRDGLWATIVSFLIAGTYVLAFAYLLVPIIHPLTLYALLLDAGFLIVWAVLFDHMYGKPLLGERFRRRL